MNGLLGLGSYVYAIESHQPVELIMSIRTVTSASSIQLDLTGNQNVDGHTVLENVSVHPSGHEHA